MTTLRFYFGGGKGGKVGDPFRRWRSLISARIRDAMRFTANWAGSEIQSRGVQDIRAAGFQKWADGLHVKVSEGGGNIRVGVTHDIPWFEAYQRDQVIKGKPLLWIPASWAQDAKGLGTPLNFPGQLVKVTPLSGGRPLLISTADRQVKYIGVDQVSIPKKFHTLEIIQDVQRDMVKQYERRLASTRGT